MSIENEMIRKKSNLPNEIRSLDKRVQVARNAYAFYNMNNGNIDLGCEEKYVATAIWHENMHMLFFEQFFLEANYMWDNIAHELQEYLFNEKIPDKPYIYTRPPIKAKSIDDGWYTGRKQREKSIRVGFKPEIKKRIPVKHLS